MITDAVMQMVVADFVFQKIPDFNISEATNNGILMFNAITKNNGFEVLTQQRQWNSGFTTVGIEWYLMVFDYIWLGFQLFQVV